ncbi:MAG TPA: amidohydrolase [Lentisphaeria bacterium]|nr:amidohydrolase [Lentisphaeria bacterium]|tara:strand:- start:1297 stop:2145 length:849 start_codon:yes stop_codon:yes gene_type:complete
MPDFPIIDTHLHLSDPSRISYPWINSAPALNRPFTIDDYREACGDVEVEAMVFMEVDPNVDDRQEEIDFVCEVAATEPRLKGMIAQAPLEQGAAIRPELENLANNPLIKGVRRLLQDEDVDFCLSTSFIEGVRQLPDFGIPFDICIYHRHLANVVKMVQQCPDVQFILDHIGKPGIKDGLLEPWKSDLKDLAALPNVMCKISGMTTEADMENWTRDDLRPYFDHVIECFGFDRVVYGGDWFVASLATTYPRFIETLDWAVAGCSDEELKKLYRDNAQKFYRI